MLLFLLRGIKNAFFIVIMLLALFSTSCIPPKEIILSPAEQQALQVRTFNTTPKILYSTIIDLLKASDYRILTRDNIQQHITARSNLQVFTSETAGWLVFQNIVPAAQGGLYPDSSSDQTISGYTLLSVNIKALTSTTTELQLVLTQAHQFDGQLREQLIILPKDYQVWFQRISQQLPPP